MAATASVLAALVVITGVGWAGRRQARTVMVLITVTATIGAIPGTSAVTGAAITTTATTVAVGIIAATIHRLATTAGTITRDTIDTIEATIVAIDMIAMIVTTATIDMGSPATVVTTATTDTAALTALIAPANAPMTVPEKSPAVLVKDHRADAASTERTRRLRFFHAVYGLCVGRHGETKIDATAAAPLCFAARSEGG